MSTVPQFGEIVDPTTEAGCDIGEETRAGPDPSGPPLPRARPEIVVTQGNLPATVTAAEDALLVDGGEPIFQQGGLLVRVTRTSDVTVSRGLTRQPGSLVIVAAEEFYLTERLTRAATWFKPDARSHSLRRIDCPPHIARHLMARVGEWRTPVLTGIIETPTLRPDGSILDRPGYDEATGILYEPGAAKFPSVSEHPTRDQAEGAMAELLEVVKGFPFVSEVSRAATVSMFLTAVVRRSLRSAPAFPIGAPTMGSGKSLVADCGALIATGRRAAAMTQASDDSEDQKRWLAALLAGDPIVLIDNVSRPLGSDALNSILTQETYRARILGASKQMTVSTAVTILATGNNLVILGDLRTRVIPIDLDPRVERPEERRFDIDLLEWIPRHRGELVRACLTILRAYHVAGRPEPPEPVFGRFEDWSAWVRGAVMWLGLLDPCLGRRQLESRDPVAHNLRALLINWREAIGPRRVTASELIREAELPVYSSLKEALVELAGDRTGAVNARRLGHALMAFERRIESGLRIVRAGERQGVALWMVEKDDDGESSAVGMVGSEGFSISPPATCHDSSYKGGGTYPQNPRNPRDGGEA
jgi:putative DNA primase/helicase